jgi:hypothetical protein
MLRMFSRRKRVKIAIERREQISIETRRHLNDKSELNDLENHFDELTSEESAERLKYIRMLDGRMDRSLKALHARRLPEAQDMRDMATEEGRNCPLLDLMRYFTPTWSGTPRDFYPVLFRFLRELSGFTSLKDTQQLKALQSAAYRAHLTRRVRPPMRRFRAPRPLYAIPRPPSAPLAPPVA